MWLLVLDASDGHEAVTLFTAQRLDFCQHGNIKMMQCHEWCCGVGGGVRTPKPAAVALLPSLPVFELLCRRPVRALNFPDAAKLLLRASVTVW